MPAILKILIVFGAMLALTRVKLPLGLALVLGGLVLSAWSGQPLPEMASHLWATLISADLWLLLVVTAMIIEIGRFMTDGRNAEQIVTATRQWGGRHGRAATLISVPAVIGLIPMPAGALFSAPFVEQAGAGVGVTPQWKSGVNYWFRHVWEYWWPLYPGVIIAMQTFEMVETWQFIAVQIVFTPIAVGAGYLFLIRPHVRDLASSDTDAVADKRRVAFLLLPVLIVLLAVVIIPPGLKSVVPGMSEALRKLYAMAAGLLIALILILWDARKAGGQRPFSTLFKGKSLNVMLSLGGVLVFKGLLERSGLLPVASVELVESGIPLVVAVAALPFLAGLVTGIALGFTGVSFPLVVGLLASEGSGLTPLATLVLAYGVGYMGMILSPVHLCLLVTRDYFNTSMMRIYRTILPCVVTVLLATLILHVVLHLLAW